MVDARAAGDSRRAFFHRWLDRHRAFQRISCSFAWQLRFPSGRTQHELCSLLAVGVAPWAGSSLIAFTGSSPRSRRNLPPLTPPLTSCSCISITSTNSTARSSSSHFSPSRDSSLSGLSTSRSLVDCLAARRHRHARRSGPATLAVGQSALLRCVARSRRSRSASLPSNAVELGASQLPAFISA